MAPDVHPTLVSVQSLGSKTTDRSAQIINLSMLRVIIRIDLEFTRRLGPTFRTLSR